MMTAKASIEYFHT